MTDSEGIASELSRTFEAATMQYLSRAGGNADDWAAAREIERRSTEKIQSLQDAYERDHSERLATVMQELAKKAAQHHLEHPAPRGVAAKPAAQTVADARRIVQRMHAADVASVRTTARQEMDDLLEQALNRNRTPSVVRDAFRRASGGERQRTQFL